MRNNGTLSPSDLNESASVKIVSSSSSSRRIPKSWIIVAVLFYCASVVTVGLLAGLLPRRIHHITIYATPAPDTPTTTTTPDPSACDGDECNPRLVSDLIVHTYELEYLYNDTEQTTAQGQVKISFNLKKPVQQLIYHAKRLLNLQEPVVMQDGVHQHVSMRSYPPNDYISLRLMDNKPFVEVVPYLLIQNFTINLTDGNVGFYQNVFKDGGEEMKKLLATKFQPTDARKAFPCFDEPHLKARFRINIIHPANTIALANFPVMSEEPWENDLIYTKFEETFPMSTYLSAWAILPNTYGQTTNSSNVTVWAREEPTNKNHTIFALQVALNSLEFFKGYFNTDEPVPPKTDLLSVPDFSSGAMENWGLVSFREDRIIFDETVASTAQKQLLAETMAHEIAHFWFGNYVTCKWWDDLWLNEAMATWLSFKPFGVYYPDWNLELQVLTTDVVPVMWDDAKPSSHPIVVENVTTAAAITSLFDSITYSKGASILRMLERIVGSEQFRTSLQDYLTSNRFDVGDPNTFYNGLFHNSSISGEEFMKSWLEEQNYPLLKVDLSVENNETKLVFTQSRFIISNVLNISHLNPNYRWKINITCSAGGRDVDTVEVDLTNETVNFLLETEQETKIIPGKSYTWVKCNRGYDGFFVTHYSFPWSHFSNILDAEPTFFSDEDKVNLMQDAFLLAYRGLVDYVAPLMIIKPLVRQQMTRYVHWRTFEWHWETLAELIDYRSEILPQFQNFTIDEILSNGNTVEEILSINPDDNHSTKLIKGLQFSLLCRMNDSKAIERASELFRSIPIAYFNNSDVNINISADILSTVYTYHIKNSVDDNDWQTMFNYYKIAISPQEQTRALVAISSTNNQDRLNQLLNDGLIGGLDTIKRQDYFAMMGYMSRHSVGRDVVWTFYKNNYERLVQTFTLENRRFGTAILAIARSFETESYLHELHDFFGKYPNAGAAASSRKQALDQVAMNIEWIKSREENLRQALSTIP